LVPDPFSEVLFVAGKHASKTRAWLIAVHFMAGRPAVDTMRRQKLPMDGAMEISLWPHFKAGAVPAEDQSD
jgi:hypothetical protein